MSNHGKKPAVLVISSHVAHGAVGNRAAVFALERLGYPVVAVPTVTLAWHPGEGPATRIVPSEEAFAGMVGDIAGAGWLGAVGGILTGYLGSASQAGPVAALVAAVKARNPDAHYLCDPVVGDAAGPYVASDTIAAIRNMLLPLADMATPNRHELAFLCGSLFADNDALAAAATTLGPGEVVVTSAYARPGKAANLLVTGRGSVLVSHAASHVAPHGTGDLLAALYLAHRLGGRPPRDACRRAVGSTLRLIEMADGAAALPLADGQAALLQPHPGVVVESAA